MTSLEAAASSLDAWSSSRSEASARSSDGPEAPNRLGDHPGPPTWKQEKGQFSRLFFYMVKWSYRRPRS